jgi:hypothetical protein
MKTTYVDPLVPLNETSVETLTRLSANIGVLTELIDDAEHRHLISLAGMFDQARATKVEQAEALIALLTGDDGVAEAPIIDLPPKPEAPVWQESGIGLQIVGELMQVGDDEFAAERRFLLVGNSASESSAMDFRFRGGRRQQSQRVLTDGNSSSSFAHPLFLSLGSG